MKHLELRQLSWFYRCYQTWRSKAGSRFTRSLTRKTRRFVVANLVPLELEEEGGYAVSCSYRSVPEPTVMAIALFLQEYSHRLDVFKSNVQLIHAHNENPETTYEVMNNCKSRGIFCNVVQERQIERSAKCCMLCYRWL